MWYMGPSYLKQCTICKQWTLVWTLTPDLLRGLAGSVTGLGHNRLSSMYRHFWFIFALGNWFNGQNPNLGLGGVCLWGGGLSPSH